MTADPSDADFTRQALARLPAPARDPAFEATLLAGYEDWQARRSRSALAAVMRGFRDLVWPGAPLWVPAGALAASLLLGIVLGTALPAPGEERMAFSLDQTPGFSLLTSDAEEDL